MKVRAIVAAVALVAGFQPAFAEEENPFENGNAFLSVCGQPSSKGYVAWPMGCMGGAIGFLHGYNARPGSGVCVPPEATAAQLLDIVLAYVRSHPSIRHLRTWELMRRAFGEAFPCNASGK